MASGATFTTFASAAAETLGFPVTAANVAGACEALNIPSNREAARNRPPSSVLERLDRIERVLTACGLKGLTNG